MWAKFMEVENGYLARVWRDLFVAEGVAIRVMPPLDDRHAASAPREIWVPDSKTHVAAEILRKV